MLKFNKIAAVSILGISLAGSAFANSLNLNLDAGIGFSKNSSNQSVTPIPGSVDNFLSNQGLQSGPFMGAGIEYDLDHWTTKPFTLGLGLSAYAVDLGVLSGTNSTTVGGAPFGTLNYYMLAQSSVIMFEPKLIYTASQRFQPYILAGAGYAWNTLSDFVETPPDLEDVFPYSDHTTGHFAYEGGLGLQYALSSNPDNSLFLRAEYRYLSLGNAELGPRDFLQTTSDRFVASNISVHVFDIGLTYRF